LARRRAVGLRSGLPALALGILVGALLLAGSAQGERAQYGSLIVSLDGRLSPLTLPREGLAPVAVGLSGDLRTADGSPLPPVTRVEIGLPRQGVLSTYGLPTCSRRRLRVTDSAAALAVCGEALVGRGRIAMTVQLPGQQPYAVHARLLAFNASVGERRAVLLHVYAPKPPFSVVIPLLFSRGEGRFGMTLAADLPTFVHWVRFAQFEMTFWRLYAFRGYIRSYLNASCPIPKSFTAGFFSFARIIYTLADGREVSTAIARSCRAR
jgi:hypothetical protein